MCVFSSLNRVAAVGWLGLALSACAPKVVVKNGGPLPAAAVSPASYAPLLVVKENEPFTDPAAQELGDIHIRDSGFTLICDYDMAVDLASQRARQLGANVLRIYEHRLPSALGSNCHRIRAKALRVPDLTPYEKEIIWHPQRRLRQVDFKGSPDNRPFEAATSSGFRYRSGSPTGVFPLGKTVLLVETYFDCQNSYFKGTRNAAYTLQHEQVHFDLSEVFARRFTKLLQEQVTNTQELQLRHDDLYRQLSTEWQQLQDKYDSEVYQNPQKLPQWQQYVERELQTLQPYADKQVVLKIKV